MDKPSRDLSVVWNASNERAEPSAMECQYTRLGGLRRSLARSWSAVRAKIAGDINNLKADVAHKKHDLDAKIAEKHADQLEWEAGFAIDYAIASVEQAEWSVLDAVAAPCLCRLRERSGKKHVLEESGDAHQ